MIIVDALANFGIHQILSAYFWCDLFHPKLSPSKILYHTVLFIAASSIKDWCIIVIHIVKLGCMA